MSPRRLGLDARDLDSAALLQMGDIEVEDLLAALDRT